MGKQLRIIRVKEQRGQERSYSASEKILEIQSNEGGCVSHWDTLISRIYELKQRKRRR